MELIELHILQSFPVTCLNRDDVGAPKSAFFGGVQRARVSSQSWKRAIRAMARESQPGVFAGTRTRYVITDLKQRFLRAGQAEPEAKALAAATADALGKLDSVERGNVKTLLYFSPMEMDNVVCAVLASGIALPLAKSLQAATELEGARDAEDKKTSEKSKKTFEDAQGEIAKLCKRAAKKLGASVKDAADIALFGRMVADDHTLSVEGAGLFSHALSTHQATNEVEFFSAVDDTPNVEEEGAGAGHIGTLEFNSACYYRYVGVNLDLLRDADHLGEFGEDQLRGVLETFVRSSLLAVPGARKNSMFGFNPPAYALGLRRRGQPLSLVNAFERPVRPKGEGYCKPSIEALEHHLSELRGAYGLSPDIEVRVPATTIDEFIERLVGTETPAGV